MPVNLLQHAAHRAYGGFPVLGAAEEAVPAEVEPYAASFRDYIAAAYPRFPFTRHTLRLIDLAQRVADGDLRRLMVEPPPRLGGVAAAWRRRAPMGSPPHPPV